MPSGGDSLLAKLLVPAGLVYLGYLATQPPPARWVGIGCLVVVAPFLAGWLLGNLAGVGPWADSEAK
jgi:hypothetical protein